jgi:hypothetical protein
LAYGHDNPYTRHNSQQQQTTESITIHLIRMEFSKQQKCKPCLEVHKQTTHGQFPNNKTHIYNTQTYFGNTGLVRSVETSITQANQYTHKTNPNLQSFGRKYEGKTPLQYHLQIHETGNNKYKHRPHTH